MSLSEDFRGYAVTDPKNFTKIKIYACGVCSSCIHTVRGDHGGWGPWTDGIDFMICGHEASGFVEGVGSNVTEFKVGDKAGVGAQVYSCGTCKACKDDNECYCMGNDDGHGPVDTYNAKYPDEAIAHGCYANRVRVDQRFVFKIPDDVTNLEDYTAIFCGGATVYSPITRHMPQGGSKILIAGVGGLGSFAVQISKALGFKDIVAVTSHKDKVEDIKKMGATDVLVSTEKDWEAKYAKFFDLVVCTIDNASGIDIGKLASTLSSNKKLVMCGIPDEPIQFKSIAIAGNGTSIVGTHIASKQEQNALVKLVHDHHIETQKILWPMSRLGEAYKGVNDNTVRYRYILKADIE